MKLGFAYMNALFLPKIAPFFRSISCLLSFYLLSCGLQVLSYTIYHNE